MKFKFESNIKFEAKNLDDAFEQLSKHFKELGQGASDSHFEFIGKFDLKKIKKEEYEHHLTTGGQKGR